MAQLISAPKPVYPVQARAAEAEGMVQLLGVIGVDGSVLSLQLDTSSPGTGNPDLVQAAIDAVRQWRYRPALLNGAPVEVQTTIRVSFMLVDAN